ncbi:hypothetical protein FJZ53_00735 [Candidatus Woesearchaeota archaeon]|nr:hypothetical protein [Candidatus Woesearchaeota archaeon]
MKMIDIHVHTEFTLERLLSIHGSFKDLDLTKEKFLEDIKSLSIEYAFSIGKKDGMIRNFFDDTTTASTGSLVEEQGQHPFLKRIIAASLTDGGNLNQARMFLEKNLVEGIKIYLGYSVPKADDERLKPYYELASEFQKPVLLHTGECYKSGKNVSPKEVISVLERYAKQKFVLCHFGYPLVKDLEEVVTAFDNAFTDLSGLMTYEDVCNGEAETRLEDTKASLDSILNNPKTSDKVMYGSDYPLISLKQYYGMIKRIVPEGFHEKVFYKNAKEFFNL